MDKILTDIWYLYHLIQTLNDEQPLNNSASVFYLWLMWDVNVEWQWQ